MAVCALVSSRVRSGSATNPRWDLTSFSETDPIIFYAEAKRQLADESPSDLDLLRAQAILAIASILKPIGLQHWSTYTQDIYTSVVWGAVIWSREQQSNVLYPTEIGDAYALLLVEGVLYSGLDSIRDIDASTHNRIGISSYFNSSKCIGVLVEACLKQHRAQSMPSIEVPEFKPRTVMSKEVSITLDGNGPPEVAGFTQPASIQTKRLWLAGLANTFSVPGTAAAALIIDRLGRIKSFITQGIALLLVTALIKASRDAAASGSRDQSTRLGTAAASFVFVYIWLFTMFNIVPCWIYGTEIWPTKIPAKGYSFTICGWAVGCGMTQFVIPIMRERLGWATYIFFGAINSVALPSIYFFYPDVAKSSQEEINLLFSSDSLFVSKNMQGYQRRLGEAGGQVAVAARRLLDEVEGQLLAAGRSDKDTTVIVDCLFAMDSLSGLRPHVSVGS